MYVCWGEKIAKTTAAVDMTPQKKVEKHVGQAVLKVHYVLDVIPGTSRLQTEHILVEISDAAALRIQFVCLSTSILTFHTWSEVE